MVAFTYKPSYSTSMSRSPLVYEAAYGDGYSQRTPMGINNTPQKWSLNWNNISSSMAANIDAFLAGQGGTLAFDWTPPHGTTGRYICKDWQVNYTGPDKNTATATFQQVFE